MATNTSARARTSVALAQPKTPEEMADIASAIVSAASAVTPLLIRFGLGMVANIVDRPGAIKRLQAAGKGEASASAYASAAPAMATAHNVSAEYRKAVADGIGYHDAYEWARAIVAADKRGDKPPTRAAVAKAKAARKAAKAEAEAERRSQGADKATSEPATVADVVDIIGPLVDKAARASGDVVTFYANLATWAVGQYEARKAAADTKARATTAK